MIKNIRLQNFSLFTDFTLGATKGINVIIGENGTGKTHLLKAIYALCNMSQTQKSADFDKYFNMKVDTEYFGKSGNQYASFELNSNSDVPNCTIANVYGGTHREGWTKNNEPIYSGIATYNFSFPKKAISAVFIPVKDMLTHSKGLLEMADKYHGFPFDKGLLDIVKFSKRLRLKKPPELALSILPILEKMIDGTVDFNDDEFYIKKNDGRQVSFAAEAEGFKKIGLLWQLLMNESITAHTVLLWDEPDANLNPKLLPSLVDCLFTLSRSGVQIFIGTHSYLLAKYFDVKKQANDDLRFHSLYFENKELTCEINDRFADLEHNAILEAFDALVGEVYGIDIDD